MEFKPWSSEYATGIDVIDEQHKQIFVFINKLSAAGTAGSSRDELKTIIDGLIDYTMMHFEFEEKLQEKAGYPFLVAHKSVHKMFKKRIDQFVDRFNNGEDVSADLTNMLMNWLITHIKRDDQDYVPVVRGSLDGQDKKSWLADTLKRVFG